MLFRFSAIAAVPLLVLGVERAAPAEAQNWADATSKTATWIMRGVSATNNLQHLRTAIEAGSFFNNVLDYGKASGSVYPELVPGTAIKIGQIGLGAFELYQRKKEYKLSYGTLSLSKAQLLVPQSPFHSP